MAMTTVTRGQWDRRFYKAFRALRRSRPDLSPEWARRNAHRSTTVELGPRPPGTVGLALGALGGYLSGGANVKWGKVAWKTLRPLLGAAALAAAYEGGRILLEMTDTAGELQELGAPVFVIPILLALGAGLRNWLKHRKAPKA